MMTSDGQVNKRWNKKLLHRALPYNNYLTTVSQHHTQCVTTICSSIPNLQAAAIPFRLCKVTSIFHLLQLAVWLMPPPLPADSGVAPPYSFLHQDSKLHQPFIQCLACSSLPVPMLSSTIAFAPECIGGLGFPDVRTSLVPRLAKTLAKPLSTCQSGTPINFQACCNQLTG